MEAFIPPLFHVEILHLGLSEPIGAWCFIPRQGDKVLPLSCIVYSSASALLDSGEVGCEQGSGTSVSQSPFTTYLLYGYGNNFHSLVAEWNLWRPSCLQIEGEVASLPLFLLCCIFQSSNPRSYGMSLEMRRKMPGCTYALSPSWCPSNKFSHSLHRSLL